MIISFVYIIIWIIGTFPSVNTIHKILNSKLYVLHFTSLRISCGLGIPDSILLKTSTNT